MGRRAAEPLDSPGSPQLIEFLAAAAAAVSFTAQHQMVDATRHLPVVDATRHLPVVDATRHLPVVDATRHLPVVAALEAAISSAPFGLARSVIEPLR